MDCRLNRNKNTTRCKKLRLIRDIPKKGLSWKQAKLRYPKLSPNGNADRDIKKNKKDCKPFDKKKQDDFNPYSDYDTLVSPRIYKAFEILKYGEDLGLPARETHNELKEKGYSGDEMRQANRLITENNRGKRIGSYHETDYFPSAESSW